MDNGEKTTHMHTDYIHILYLAHTHTHPLNGNEQLKRTMLYSSSSTKVTKCQSGLAVPVY